MTGAVRMRTTLQEILTTAYLDHWQQRNNGLTFIPDFTTIFDAASTFYVFITSNPSGIKIISIQIYV